MALTLKLEDGHPVLQDGKPVYVNEDGSEVVFDANTAFTRISELNREAAKHRTANKELKAKTEGLDLEGLRDLQQKSMSAEQMLLAQKSALEDAQRRMESQERKHREVLRKMVLGDQFTRSKFIQERLNVPPELVEAFFGKNFNVEEDGDGNPTIVAKQNGQPILSRARPGETADFDEALLILTESYPNRDRILKTPSSTGSGSKGGFGTSTIGKRISQMDAVEKATVLQEIGTDAFQERLAAESAQKSAQGAKPQPQGR